MDRRQMIIKDLNLNGKGLEIGPSHNPCVKKSDGYDVEIIDHLDREGLREKYKNHGVNIDNIEEVDYIWQGGSYLELTKKREYYDYIIASHLIEHTTDLISFFQDCTEMLKPDGKIALAIPDKRYCFDHFRTITDIGKVIDDYFQERKNHSVGSVAEYYMDIVRRNADIAWLNGGTDDKFEFFHTVKDAMNGIDGVVKKGEYHDIHEYRFIPESFYLLMEDLRSLGFINLEITSISKTIGHEFFVTLEKCLDRTGRVNNTLRMALFEKIFRSSEEYLCDVSSVEEINNEFFKMVYREKADECLTLHQKLEEKINENASLEQRLEQKINENLVLIENLEQKTKEYETISNAFFWKITKPARVIMDGLKKIIKH